MKKIEIPLIPNEDYDIIEYCGESTKIFDPPKGYEKIYDIINNVLNAWIEKKAENKIEKITIESVSEKIFEELKPNIVAYNLKKISEKYDIDEVEELFNSDEKIEQIMDIISVLIDGKIVLGNYEFTLCDGKDKYINLKFASKIYNQAKNEKIKNQDYHNLYEMEREVLSVLTENLEFAGLIKNNPTEASNILYIILKGEIFNENLVYSNVHEIIRTIELFAKKYPHNSGEAVEYFLTHGNKMLPVYKEVYEYVDFFSKEYAELDYTVILKITKHCKKLGITDGKIIKERLSFTELKKLEKIMIKNGVNNI